MRNKDGKYNLMFEEWVSDSLFIISPRISFEVSVHHLGGLMALSYAIATILKRRSHIFSDDKALPAKLKTKLSIEGDVASNPKEALSLASTDRRTKHLMFLNHTQHKETSICLN